jgi:LmbE family N-acetylglucosaminyl deacetylase
MRVLAFSPHPDDVEILCAGTLAKYASQGHEVAVAYVTDGGAGSPTLPSDEIAAIRKSEAEKSAAVLGARFIWMGIADEFLYDSPEVRMQFIEVIRSFGPDLVLCPDKDQDYHPDHTRTGQIVWDTHIMTPVPNMKTASPPCKKIHEIWYFDTIAGINFVPEHYVDISDHWETKIRMLDCHVSQNVWLMDQYGVEMKHYAETQSRFRGFQCNALYAEAFRRPKFFPSPVPKDGLLPGMV